MSRYQTEQSSMHYDAQSEVKIGGSERDRRVWLDGSWRYVDVDARLMTQKEHTE